MKYSLCNELFGKMPILDSARIAAAEGFSGLEIAPYTVFGDFSPAAFRSGSRSLREAFAQTGLAFAGFHWLLLGPEGLHATTADAAVRRKTWDHVRRLLDASGELGGGVLIFGSPRQRSSTGGRTASEATATLTEELAAIGPYAAERASKILIEALSSDQSDVVNTLAEAERLVAAVNSPGVGGMFDFHNTGDETAAWDALIRAHRNLIAHVHVNEPDGSAPRRGGADFRPGFGALRETGYAGWISVEIFSEPPDPAATIRESMALFRSLEGASAPSAGLRI